MEEPISEGEITVEGQPIVDMSNGIVETTKVFEKTPFLVDLDALLDQSDDDAHWVFGVGGPA